MLRRLGDSVERLMRERAEMRKTSRQQQQQQQQRKRQRVSTARRHMATQGAGAEWTDIVLLSSRSAVGLLLPIADWVELSVMAP